VKSDRHNEHDIPQHMREFLTTRSHAWRDAGLARQLSRRAVKRARIQSLVLLPVLVGVLVVYTYRHQIFGASYDTPVRVVTFLVLISLGWQFARDVGKALGPTLFRRMDPGTAGTLGFLLRLVTGPRRSRWAARSRPSSSVSPRSRRWATCSPAWCC
jgi:hypothetical protein